MNRQVVTYPDTGTLQVGETWEFGVLITDGSSVKAYVHGPQWDGAAMPPPAEAPLVSVNLPIQQDGSYHYCRYAPNAEGLQSAYMEVLRSDGLTEKFTFSVLVEAVFGTAVPQIADVKAYLLAAGGSVEHSDNTILSALDAERKAQASRCKIPHGYSWDLREALLRRVARNLAMRNLPLGLQTSMSEAAVATVRVGQDSEISRLEAPYKRRTVG